MMLATVLLALNGIAGDWRLPAVANAVACRTPASGRPAKEALSIVQDALKELNQRRSSDPVERQRIAAEAALLNRDRMKLRSLERAAAELRKKVDDALNGRLLETAGRLVAEIPECDSRVGKVRDEVESRWSRFHDLVNRADSHCRSGDVDVAMTLYQQAWELNAESPSVREKLLSRNRCSWVNQ